MYIQQFEVDTQVHVYLDDFANVKLLTDRWTDRQMNVQTGGQTDRWTDR